MHEDGVCDGKFLAFEVLYLRRFIPIKAYQLALNWYGGPIEVRKVQAHKPRFFIILARQLIVTTLKEYTLGRSLT